MSSSVTSFSTARRPVSGFDSSSATISSTCRPRMPPPRLMRSTAICMPITAVLPPNAATPVSGCSVPIRKGFLAWPSAMRHGPVATPAPPSAAALVASTRRRVITPPFAFRVLMLSISPPSPFGHPPISSPPGLTRGSQGLLGMAGSSPAMTSKGLQQKLQDSGRPRHVAISQIAAARAVRDVIGLERGEAIMADDLGMFLQPVEPRGVAAEDRGLDRALGRPQRLEPVFLLHVLGDLQPAQPFDLPLRRAGPHRIGAPDQMVCAEPADQ